MKNATWGILIIFLLGACQQQKTVDKQVENLIGQMSLKEKAGQMIQLDIVAFSQSGKPNAVDPDFEKVDSVLKNYHVGSFLNGKAIEAEKWVDFITQLQKHALEHSINNIPMVYALDHTHGAGYLKGSTVFPHQINLGASFNDSLAYQTGFITTFETAGIDHHWNFAPVLGIAVNPNWPRFYETFGEDPLIASRMGAAFTKGVQSEKAAYPYKVAACAKHFIGYSNPVSGWDRTTASIPDQKLQEYYLPPFKEAIEAGAKTVMVNSSDINGIPVHANKKLLTSLLRNKLQFNGVVITDHCDVEKLYNYHKVAKDRGEALVKVIDAGIDMIMTTSANMASEIVKLVRKGEINERRIDESVRRILLLKKELGLFENPYPLKSNATNIGSKKNKQVALEAARESIVLLKNDNALPLGLEVNEILVIGPSANSKKNLCGGWTLNWKGEKDDSYYPTEMLTIFEAFQKVYKNKHVKTFGFGPGKLTTRQLSLVKQADAVILAMGEKPYTEFTGNVADIRLPEEQELLVAQVKKLNKKTILVMVAGRPRIIHPVIEKCDAIIWAGLPGYEGGMAIAEIIKGNIVPSGKLPFSYPAYPAHQIPYFHDKKDESTNDFEFGEGMSYTEFTYSDLELNKTELSPNGTIMASVTVKNTGDIDAKEAVLWFITDKIGKITRPVKILKHYEKKTIRAGNQQVFHFKITPGLLKYPDEKGNPVMETGEFELQVKNLNKNFTYKN